MTLKPIINFFRIVQFSCAHARNFRSVLPLALVRYWTELVTGLDCSVYFLYFNLKAFAMPQSVLCICFCTQTGRHQPNRAEIIITLTMTNYIKRRDVIGSGRNSHFCLVLVSDADNKVVFKQRLR